MRSVPREAWKALFAAQLGWMLDATDFLLFTYALRAIQPEFGLSDRAMALLVSIALIAGAIGGVTFGSLADRLGRVRAMTLSIFLYSFATAGLATSTSFITLAFWRFLVGFGMGGEWSCGSVLVAESWPAEHRAKAIGIMQSGWAIGALLAAGMSALLLEPFGWRVLFLAGIFPAGVALVIRRTVKEPAMWTRSERKESRIAELFRRPLRRSTVIASTLAALVLIAYWGLFTWLPGFLATPVAKGGAGFTLTKSALWMIVVQLGSFAGYLTFGWFADKIGRRPAFTFFMIAASIVVPLYALAPSTTVLLLVGPLVGFFGSGYFSLFGALLAELYPTSVRATGQGFCYNIGRLASAGGPYVIALLAAQKGLGAGIAINCVFFLLAAVVIWLLPETQGRSLEAAALRENEETPAGV